MESEAAAAIAALIVAVFAMTVALAQVVQQYLVTGQLIRMCDSVVYGKMPGQGRRMWEFSQFRFRVVYSVPQISLRSSLWSQSLSCHLSYTKGHLPVPDLRHSEENPVDFRKALDERIPRQQRRCPYSPVPGEAPWVSYCRAVQYASGNDLLYELADGDADRCPADISVVPMQVSMRDIVTMALMAGMRCTDASFEKKSLAMEGSVGNMTSSWHPILGAIIRFVPRNCSQPSGLRVGNGNVNPQWMSRMWDVVIIAGRPYSQQERRYYKTYEDYDWITLSRDRTVAKVSTRRAFASPLSSSSSLRRRRNSAPSSRSNSERGQTSALLITPLTTSERGTVSFTSEVDSTSRRNRYDGVWDFESDDAISVSPSKAESIRGPSIRNSLSADHKHRPSWYERLAKRFARSFATRPPKSLRANADSYNVDVEDGMMTMKAAANLPETSLNGHDAQDFRETNEHPTSQENWQSRPGADRHRATSSLTRQSGRRLLDGEALQRYIAEKRHVASSPLRHGPLLLTWPTTEEEGEVSGEKQEPHDAVAPSNDWQGPYSEMKRERSRSYADRWRNTIRSRSRRRERRHSEAAPKKARRRRSSAISGAEPDVESSGDDRPVSQRPKKSGRRSSASLTPPHVERRGRRRARSPSNSENRQPPYSSRRDDTSRERTRESYNMSQQEQDLLVTYGNAPVNDFKDADDVKTAGRSYDGDNSEAADRQQTQNASVAFNLYSEGDRPYSGRSDTDGSFNRPIKTPRRSASDPPMINSPTRERSNSLGELTSQPGGIISSEDHKHPAKMPEDQNPKRNIKDNADLNSPKSTNAEVAATGELVNDTSSERTPSSRDFDEEDKLGPDVPFKSVPEGARWTRIDRSMVDPTILEVAGEKFWERSDYVVVLRLLSREEIQRYADRTRNYRSTGQLTGERASSYDRGSESSDSDEGKLRPSTSSPARRKPSPIGYHYNHPQNKRFLSPRRRSDMSPVRDRISATNWLHDSALSLGSDLRLSQSPSRISEADGSEQRFQSPRARKRERRGPEDSISFQESNEKLSTAHNDDDDFFEADSFIPSRCSSTSSRAVGSDEDDFMSVDSIRSNEIVRFGTPFPSRIGEGYPESSVDFISNDSTSTSDTRNEGEMDWLWICQADVIPGYFATPWHHHFSEPVCVGAISAMIELLRHFTTPSTLTFTQSYPQYEPWIREGRSTHPSYAINAMGGIIASGKYTRVQFPCLETRIPPIQLLRSYPYQVSTRFFNTTALTEHLAELMALDTWLAFCGRLPSICDGRNNLLRRMPPLIQKIMDDFAPDFRDLDRTAMEGGWQVITEMAELVRQELAKEGLSEAEQLFTAVAVLRTAKMALAVVKGPRTEKLRDILLEDAQVYLV